MKIRDYKIATAALAAAVAAGGFAPTVVIAQDDRTEEVTVTGTRIKRLDPQLPTPVQVFDAEYIENSGAANMQDFLFTASFAGPGLFNENSTLSQTAGTANFDSRGFGDDYVVILLNGRRLPGDPLGGDSATNLNLIPLAAVERVEYLSTGASAIYGADAVQGVLNVITRQEYDGIQGELRYTDSTGGDGAQVGASMVGGVIGDAGYATIAFEYQQQDDVDAKGLPLIGSAIAPDGTDGRSPTGLPGTYLDFGAGVSYPAPGCPAGSPRPAQFTSLGEDCAFDFAPLYDAIPAQERYNFLASSEFAFDDMITGYGEFRFSRIFTEVRNGAAPAFFNITGTPALASVDAELGTDLANSPSVFILRRAVDAGPRATDNTNTAFSTVLGSRINFDNIGELDLSVQHVESEMNRVGVGGQLSVSRVEDAVASGLFDVTQTYSPAFFNNNGIAISTQRQAVGTESQLRAEMTGDLPFSIGTVPVAYAIGARYKEDEFFDRADVSSTEGDVAGGASSNGSGSRKIRSVYGELAITPTDNVEVSLAARTDNYGWIGLNTRSGDDQATYMAGVSFRAMPNLLLRASAGTGFKAPALGELFLGRSFGVTTAVDTTLCNAANNDPNATQMDIDNACRSLEIRSVSGGNPELQTESSDNLSAGLVWEPMDNLTVALDYYDISVEDKIGSLTVQEIVNNEANFPNLITRVNGSLSVPGAEVRSNLQNLNKEEGQGIDLSTRSTWDLNNGNRLVGDVRIAYLLSHKRQLSALQPLCEDAGTTSEPDYRINGQLGYEASNYNIILTARFLGETDDLVGGRDTASNSCTPNPDGEVRGVDSYLELGLRGSYQL
ncbi:MAG: TonB-dependent receptor, partial [Gammaproteobacteria bacterium]|nr:TonB-dependent receptor [Gammaproteobacteria bacterium]